MKKFKFAKISLTIYDILLLICSLLMIPVIVFHSKINAYLYLIIRLIGLIAIVVLFALSYKENNKKTEQDQDQNQDQDQDKNQ